MQILKYSSFFYYFALNWYNKWKNLSDAASSKWRPIIHLTTQNITALVVVYIEYVSRVGVLEVRFRESCIYFDNVDITSNFLCWLVFCWLLRRNRNEVERRPFLPFVWQTNYTSRGKRVNFIFLSYCIPSPGWRWPPGCSSWSCPNLGGSWLQWSYEHHLMAQALMERSQIVLGPFKIPRHKHVEARNYCYKTRCKEIIPELLPQWFGSQTSPSTTNKTCPMGS